MHVKLQSHGDLIVLKSQRKYRAQWYMGLEFHKKNYHWAFVSNTMKTDGLWKKGDKSPQLENVVATNLPKTK